MSASVSSKGFEIKLAAATSQNRVPDLVAPSTGSCSCSVGIFVPCEPTSLSFCRPTSSCILSSIQNSPMYRQVQRQPLCANELPQFLQPGNTSCSTTSHLLLCISCLSSDTTYHSNHNHDPLKTNKHTLDSSICKLRRGVRLCLDCARLTPCL
jgi:hypothetical protein